MLYFACNLDEVVCTFVRENTIHRTGH